MESADILSSLTKEKEYYDECQAKEASEEAMSRKLARDIAVKRFSEKEILPSFDKNGKEIKRPAIVFMSTVGGGNQKVG